MANIRGTNDPIALPARGFDNQDLEARIKTALPGSNPGRQARVDAAVASAYEFNDARAAGITKANYVFGQSRALLQGMGLSRASTATYVGNGPLRRTAQVDAARFANYPDTGARRGLLVEAQNTNMALASQDVSDPAWSRSNMTTPTVNQMVENSSNTAHGITQPANYIAGQPTTLSCSVKPLGSGAKRYLYLQMAAAANGGSTPAAKFDPTNGAISTITGGATATVAVDLDGRYTCSLTFTPSSTVTDTFTLRLSDTNAAGSTYQGDGVSGIDINDIQLEDSAFHTSRIPTTTAPVTRAADILTVDMALYGVAEGATNIRYTFDDGTTQDVTQTVAYGQITVPNNLNRRFLTGIATP